MNNNWNWYTEHDQILKGWRVNGDHPIFVRVIYLVIMELTIATLFAQVFVMRHQMSCCRFLCFSSGFTSALLETHRNPLEALLLQINRPSAVPVKSPNYNHSVTWVARILQVPTMRSRDILLHAKRDHLDRVHSDQIVLKMIWWGRLVW